MAEYFSAKLQLFCDLRKFSTPNLVCSEILPTFTPRNLSFCPEGSSRPTLDRRDDLFHVVWQRSDGCRVHALWSSVGKRQVRVRMGDGACLWDHLGNPLRRRGGRLTVGCGITYVEGELSLP